MKRQLLAIAFAILTLTAPKVWADLNGAPTNIIISASSVMESLPPNTLVGNFTAEDPDMGDTHTYALVSGAGDDDNALFTIDGNSLDTAVVLDYETKTNYSIRVQAMDGGGLTCEKQFTITALDDGNIPPILESFSRAVPRNGQMDLLYYDFAYTPYFIDPDYVGYQALQVKITSLPAHGTLRYRDDSPVNVGDVLSDMVEPFEGHIIYTPAAGYYGPDSFGWNAADWNQMDYYPIDYAATDAVVNIQVMTVDELNPPVKVASFGTDYTSNGKFRNPSDVAVNDNNGNVYVADTENNRIQQFDANGVFIRKWGSTGSGDGQFYSPSQIAVDSGGNVYVADQGNSRIQKFSATGAFITKWGSYGSGDGQFNWGINIAVRYGNVYVSDPYNYRIQKFDTSGTFISKWGSYGGGNGQFSYPQGVAVDDNGFVYVADTYNGRIQKFGADGSYITKWSTFLSQPRDIAYNGWAGELLVSDGASVKRFSTSGGYYGSVGNSGNGNGQFAGNMGIGAGGGYYWYVADFNNHRVQKFGYTSYLAKWGLDYSAPGTLLSPWAIAREPSGNLLVSDMDNGSFASITRYTSNGVPVAKWGSFGYQTELSQFSAPTAITVNSTGLIYVADSALTTIGTFTASGSNLNVFPFSGDFDSKIVVDASGQLYQTDNDNIDVLDGAGDAINFISPGDYLPLGSMTPSSLRGLSLGSSNTLWTMDQYNSTVFQFNTNGTLVQQWFALNPYNGPINDPLAIAVDVARGRVYILDGFGSQISCFTTSGAYLYSFGSETSPNFTDLLVDPAGTIYAVDRNNGHVLKFQPNKTVYDANLYTGVPPVLETNKPGLTFSAPKNNLITNLAAVTVVGKATDNVWVQDVFLSFNNAPFASYPVASNGPLVNFSAYYILQPGPNTIRAYARDAAGNVSATNTLSVFRLINSTLHLGTNGTGSVLSSASPFGTPTNTATLQIGRGYTVTAVAGSNWLFSNWVASVNGGPVVVATNTATYTFAMQTNLTLTAQFVTNRFLNTVGSYNGLFWDTNNGVAYASAGFANVKVTAKQGKLAAFSAQIIIAGETRASSGTFDLTGNGVSSKPFNLKADTNSLFKLYLTLPFDGTLSGVVSNLDGSWAAQLSADAAQMTSNYAGQYTMVLPGSLDPAVAPGGDGYGLVSISTNGIIALAGALGDGTALLQKVPVSENGDWPLFVPVYSTTNNSVKVKGGLLMGWMSLSNQLGGTLYLIKTPVPGTLYPNGFTNEVVPLTSTYTNSALSTNRVIELTSGSNGVVILSGGDLPMSLTNLISLSTLNMFKAPATNTAGLTNKLMLAVAVKTGKLTGSFKTNGVTATALAGVVLQNTNMGRGYFKGATNSGSLLLQGR